MRKLRIIQHATLDGVIQAPGSLEEDSDGGFRHGGWIAPHGDPLVKETILEAHGAAFDLILGRRTYDIWSGYWPKAESSPIADGLNAARKYVATSRPESLAWGPVEPLGRDLVEAVRGVKAAEGPDLILWGSSTLTPVLLGQGLADELLLFVYPVILGAGKRFYSGDAGPRDLALAMARTAPSGVIISSYKQSGAPRGAAASAA